MTKNKIIYITGILVLFFGVTNSVAAQDKCTDAEIFSAKNCAGDGHSDDEKSLFEIVNKYRVASGRTAIKLSTSLSMLANRRMLDLQQNMRSLTHSWSNCPYDIKNQSSWPCVLDAPKRLNSGYNGQGYETLYRTATGSAQPNAAITAWKKSSLHNSIILNQGMFQDMPWDEVGVAIDGQFVALWFGYSGGGGGVARSSVAGLGISYDQAVAGLLRTLSIKQVSTTVENNTWQGFSEDKKVKLEMFGAKKEISEATVVMTIRLDPNGTLDPAKKLVLATLLKNLFPEWTDAQTWLDNSINMISQDQSVWRTKIVREITIRMEADNFNSLKLSVKPVQG